jgi:single-strand DNA-binding protein
MSHYQKLIYQGNLGGDPEMRMTPSGKKVCNFSVASTVSWKNDKGEKISRTTWLKCVAWGSLADIVNDYAKKGTMVLVEGTLKPDETTGRPVIFTNSGGTASASFEVTAEKVQILTPKEKDAPESSSSLSDEDIPF